MRPPSTKVRYLQCERMKKSRRIVPCQGKKNLRSVCALRSGVASCDAACCLMAPQRRGWLIFFIPLPLLPSAAQLVKRNHEMTGKGLWSCVERLTQTLRNFPPFTCFYERESCDRPRTKIQSFHWWNSTTCLCVFKADLKLQYDF